MVTASEKQPPKLVVGGITMLVDITERKQAEEALRTSEAQTAQQRRVYEAILNNTPDLAYVFDLNHRFTYANEGLLKVWGRTWDEAIGKNCLELGYEPWHAEMHDREIEQVIATKQPIRGEVPFTGTFGRRIYDYIFVPVLGQDGEVVEVAGTTRDITERKHAEALNQCQKQSLEMLVQGEPLEKVLDFLTRSMESQSEGRFVVAIHLMEADGYHFGHVAAPSLPARYAQTTKGMDARLELGCCSSAVMSHTPTMVRDFAAQTRWPAFSAEVVSLGLRGCFTTPILSSDQRVLGTFAVYYREPRDPSPHDQQLVDLVTRTVALAIERKQSEEALNESEERFRMLSDNIPQLAWIADAGTDGQVHWFNKSWLDYTGKTIEQMSGSGWQSVHHPDHADRVIEKFQSHVRECKDWEDTFPLRGKDGQFRWFLSRMNCIRDESGKVVRIFGTNTDITERKQAEERQALLTRELQHRTKNLLSVIHSIAERSLTNGRSLDQARQAFTARLHALAHATDLLSNADWQGAAVKGVVERTLDSFAGRYSIEGEHVVLAPNATQGLALVIHELCTNAHKYGAFSTPAGRVAIRWWVEDDGDAARFLFRWQERGGPRVTPPERTGFGTTLLQVAIGGVETPPRIDYAPEGLTYTFGAPLATVAAEA